VRSSVQTVLVVQ